MNFSLRLTTTTLYLLLVCTKSFAVTKIAGAGANFPYPIYSKWFSEYEQVNKDVEFNYQAIGSHGGVRQLLKQAVDFGASDTPIANSKQKNIKFRHIPTVIGAISVAYNLPKIENLKLDGPTLSKIFMAQITKWNHKDIKDLNPKAKLPNKKIIVLSQNKSSGSTQIFSSFLSASSKEWEKSMGIGKTLNWPGAIVKTNGNPQTTQKLKKVIGSISYIELAYTYKNNLQTALIKNKNGNFIAPTLKSISAAASNSINNLKKPIIFSAGKNSYPISTFTYILLPEREDMKGAQIKRFLKWALTEGQKFAPNLNYAPLPRELSQHILEQL